MVSDNNNVHRNGDPFNLDSMLQDTAAANGQAQSRRYETDSRDGQPASSSTEASMQHENQQDDNHSTHVDIPVPENVDSATITLLAAINRTNRLLFQQYQRIITLEKKQRSRSPPRRRHRLGSPSRSSTHPRRTYRHRSYTPSSRRKDTPSPRRGRGRQNSDSPSPQPRTRGQELERKIMVEPKKHGRTPPRKERRPSQEENHRQETLTHRLSSPTTSSV
ncbi:uncharacterized protein LOC131605975 [Vicia villosa]|uniref:uncharacterized protein LOC131605975 n=1 Tax=Vicia villosa TaxID=3911 RepID=UPI00273C12A3|nr:uncharacterized protein LOC131605975 [Vicia villosa]